MPKRKRQSAKEFYSYALNADKIEYAKKSVRTKYNKKIQKIQQTEEATNRLGKIICMLIICASCIVIVFSRSQVANCRISNDVLRAALTAEKENTDIIRESTVKSTDLEYIKTEAETRLHMAKPQSYQTVEISVPKNDYTVVFNTESGEKKRGLSIGDVIPFMRHKEDAVKAE